jgi:hypothetical protein
MFSAKSGDFAERTTKSENRQSNNEKRTTNNLGSSKSPDFEVFYY